MLATVRNFSVVAFGCTVYLYGQRAQLSACVYKGAVTLPESPVGQDPCGPDSFLVLY